MFKRTLPFHPQLFLALIILTAFVLTGTDLHSQTAATVTAHEETDRVALLSKLIKRRAALASAGKTLELQACDTQIKRHPAPADADPAETGRRLAGKWHSPRHDYFYRADGTWTLIPAEQGDLHGRWRVDGNRLEIASGYEGSLTTEKYVLILITGRDLVFADGETVFFETRLSQ